MKDISVIAGLILNKQRVLVGQRPEGKPYSGYWEFPGGKIEQNETAFCALKRELQEELNINVLSADKWFEHRHLYPDETVQLKLYIIKKYHGEITAKVHQALSWVTYIELRQLRVLEGNLFFLDKLKEII